MKDDITLNEISDIKNAFNVAVTQLVVLNQRIVDETKQFEKIYFEMILPLRKNLEILTDRKVKALLKEK